MKRIGLLVLTTLFSLTLIQAQTKKAKVDMVFDKTIDGIIAHDFGSIVYGANGRVDFTYTNQGKTPLVISDVKSSCGCTIPTWTKEPVEPGKQGVITIVYNTTFPGPFSKTVVVYSNANNSPVRIVIMGKVNIQPGDIKPAQVNQNGEDRTVDGRINAAKKTVEGAASVEPANEPSEIKANLQKTNKAQLQQGQSQQAAGTKTGTEVKQSVVTPVKKK